MTDSDKKIFQVLEYLNKDNVRHNSKLTADSLKDQFSFTKEDFDNTLKDIETRKFIYRRDGTNFIAISHDGEIKFNELMVEYSERKDKWERPNEKVLNESYRISIGLASVFITGAFILGGITGTLIYDRGKIDLERNVDKLNSRIKELEDDDTNEMKTLRQENKNVWDTYQKVVVENEMLKKGKRN